MHVVFIPYGIKQKVEHLFIDMQAEKLPMTITSPDGKETKSVFVQGSLRLMPLGAVEYVFPKEHLDLILNTLNFNSVGDNRPYGLDKKILGLSPFKLVKDFLRIKDAPEFKTDKKLLWMLDGVTIIPLGIREDRDMVEEAAGEFNGWTHEAL